MQDPENFQDPVHLNVIGATKATKLIAEKLFNKALAIYQKVLGNQHPNTQNAALMVKTLYVMSFLHCKKDTLFAVLDALAQRANLPELNTEIALALLEQIESDPDLLLSIRESLHQ